MDRKIYDTYVSILKKELIPAMGCTEPISLAYAASIMKKELGCIPERIEAQISGSILKNIKSVIVPNTGGLHGTKAAIAAGVIAGDPDKILEVISCVSDEQRKNIARFSEEADISVSFLDSGLVFDMIITGYSGESSASVRIAQHHTNVIHIEHDGKVILDKPAGHDENGEKEDYLLLNMDDIFDFAVHSDISDYKDILDLQIKNNMAIAREGMKNPYGANVGKVLLNMRGSDDITTYVRAMAASGSDARMGGCEMPVVINSGSGNQGITASVPVISWAEKKGYGSEKLYRALVLSNLTAIHEKSPIGTLSAYCGAVSAGVAAGAGIAYLETEDFKVIKHTIVNAVAICSGIICDGAKPSCAAKIAASVDAGLLGYYMYLNGQQFFGGDGLITAGIEPTLKNIGRLGKEGMKQTNKEIIEMMLEDSGRSICGKC